MKNEAEFWVIKGFTVLSDGGWSCDKRVAGPFCTRRKAENAMTRHISKGETDLLVGEISEVEYRLCDFFS